MVDDDDGARLSDAEREDPPAVGAIITYRFQELTPDGVPRFPSYIGTFGIISTFFLPRHNTTQHNTTQHNTTQHNTTQHNTTQHNTTTNQPPQY